VSMSTEGKLLIGMTVGGALVIGTFPELAIGILTGYIVYIIHSRMVAAGTDQILRMVDEKLSRMEDNDAHRKVLEKLKEKAEAKKEIALLGSSLVAMGAALCPPAGIIYIVGRWAWQQRARAKTAAFIDRRIKEALNPSAQTC
jgi:hypothetical protein